MFARNLALQPAAPVDVRAPSGPGYEALRLLDVNRLEHSVGNFAVAARYVADGRGMVAMAIHAIAMEGRALTQSDFDRILTVERRLAKDGAPDLNDPDHAALRHQMLELAALAGDAASHSSTFGDDLSAGLVDLIDGAVPIETIVRGMVERTRSIEAELRSASRRIEELREQVETSRDDAQRDALTGLLNRRGALHELAVRRSAVGVVAVCDVDHFKSINDRFGHAVGDRVLKGVASSLAESVGVHTVARGVARSS
ncbi:GGDEF domain-containing protein [Sphingomonas sp. A2-49]|uniref:GGDEF domain-containing protein n=1 Tax=Sphingomonas sp. A2-49 TaxID=1391375 RepID=UPI0021CED72F|nr:diguanylate cyclase [Sphingomonas sp. A2-49]